MALIADYATLKDAVAEWLWRDGDDALAARADAFIDFFERRVARKLRTLEMQKGFTATINSAISELPPGYLEMILCKVTGEPSGAPDQVLDYVSPHIAAQLDACPFGDRAKNYTVKADKLFITPQSLAQIGATLEIDCYGFDSLATAPNGINWLLAKHPDLYLYGSLVQASAYIDDKETVAQWKAALDEGLAELVEADKRAKVGASPLVMRPSIQFVAGRAPRTNYPTS